MKKAYTAPESEKIALNLNENIAKSGESCERYWIAVGKEGEEAHLYDGRGALADLIAAINRMFGG